MSNPNHDEKGKFAEIHVEAKAGAERLGMKHHVVQHNKTQQVKSFNEGQYKMLGLKKTHTILATYKPTPQVTTEKSDLQTRIANDYFNQVKKRGF